MGIVNNLDDVAFVNGHSDIMEALVAPDWSKNVPEVIKIGNIGHVVFELPSSDQPGGMTQILVCQGSNLCLATCSTRSLEDIKAIIFQS